MSSSNWTRSNTQTLFKFHLKTLYCNCVNNSFLALDIVEVGLPGKQEMKMFKQEIELFWESSEVAISQ